MARIPVPAVRSNLGVGSEILQGIFTAARALFERRRGGGDKDDKNGDKDVKDESRKGVRDLSKPRPKPSAGFITLPGFSTTSFRTLPNMIAEHDREFRRKRPGFLKSQIRAPLNKRSKSAPTTASTQRGVGVTARPRVSPRTAAFNNVVGRLFKDPGTRNTFFDLEGRLRTGLLSPEAMSIVGGREETFEQVIERFTRVEMIRENPRLSFQSPPPSTFVRPSVNALFGGSPQPSIDPLLNIGFSEAASSGLGF